MDVSIYFKSAGHWSHYQMKEDEFKKMEQDFQDYLAGKSVKGGSYSMAPESMGGGYDKERKVLVKFDDVQFK
jgi:hypothetical protein